jgi:integral membrane protein (TIGR00529 family)
MNIADVLTNLPAYCKVGASFFGILIAYRLGLGLGYAIVAFAAALTLWTGAGLSGIVYQLHTLAKPESWLLMAVVLLLLFFTGALDKTGRMRRTIDALSAWFTSKSMLFMGLPALVGLLPMPGGALFSAPLVAAADRNNSLSPERKAAVNYWFRHVWEYWWPLYPGVILAIKYSGLVSGVYFLIQAPFTIAAIGGGYFFLLRKSGIQGGKKAFGKLDKRAALSTLLPIAIIVTASVGGSFCLPQFGVSKSQASLIGMLGGLVLGLIVVFWKNRPAFKPSCGLFAVKGTWQMMALVLGIIVFSAALSCPLPGKAGATLVTAMRDEFVSLGIPLVAVIALIPLISGAVTGVAFGFVGASFPIVFALLGPSPHFNVVCAATTFAYGCGYFGMIMSPVHICFIVTNEYFKTRMSGMYRLIFAPAMVVLCACLIMSAAYYYLIR